MLVAWTFFRAKDVPTAWRVIGAMGTLDVSRLTSGNLAPPLLYLSVCAAIAWLFPNTQQIMGKYHQSIDYYGHGQGGRLVSLQWSPDLLWAFLTAVLFAACIFLMNGSSEFIYFRF